MSKTRAFYIEHWKVIALILMLYDFVTIALSYFFGLWLRFDFRFSQIPVAYLAVYYKMIVPFALLCIVIYKYFKLYRSIWRFASYNELTNIIISNIICGALNYLITRIFGARMPISYHVVGFLMQIIFTSAIRFSY